jgi:CCR4-NOT transcription complex subunit 1
VTSQAPPTSVGDVANIFPALNQNFPTEIEDEANGYFQRIYNNAPNPTISIDEVLQLTCSFKLNYVVNTL